VDVALLQQVTGIGEEPPVLHGIDRDTTAWHLLQGWLEEHAWRRPGVTVHRGTQARGARFRLLAGYRSGTARHVLRAFVTPVRAEFAVMKPAQQMRVVIQLVGGPLHLCKVLAMIARRGLLFGPLADDVQLFPAQLGDLGQYLF
jgi:hypothetical protein